MKSISVHSALHECGQRMRHTASLPVDLEPEMGHDRVPTLLQFQRPIFVYCFPLNKGLMHNRWKKIEKNVCEN